jgi:hypothetical protein
VGMIDKFNELDQQNENRKTNLESFVLVPKKGTLKRFVFYFMVFGINIGPFTLNMRDRMRDSVKKALIEKEAGGEK